MNELIIPVDAKAGTPLYQQICEYFKQEIQEGRLTAGMRLPSSRALAASLSVSRSTVDLSYGQLVSEGYIESIPCKGYYVCQIEGIYFPVQEKERKAEPEKRDFQGKERYRYDFAMNGIAPDSFPHNTWKKLSKQVLSHTGEELFNLGNPYGEISLRKAIAEYLYQARGVHCTPEQILVGAGNDYLLMLLCTILGKNKKVAMENPTYESAWYDFRHMGYTMCTVGQDDQGIFVEDLEKTKAEVVYVMPSHQFPMGTVMPLKRRMELLCWASSSGSYIVEDDYDSEFRYRGKPIPALQGFDQADCVIYMGTFSKSIAPSIRISYMVLPKRLMERYQKAGHPFSVTVSKVDQKIVELFLKDGHYERHLNRMRSLYKSKHDRILKWLKEDMGRVCTYSGENAGIHLLIHFRNGLSEQEAVKRAKEVGIRVYGLSEFMVNGQVPPEEATILLGYATLDEKDLQQALQCLEEIWT